MSMRVLVAVLAAAGAGLVAAGPPMTATMVDLQGASLADQIAVQSCAGLLNRPTSPGLNVRGLSLSPHVALLADQIHLCDHRLARSGGPSPIRLLFLCVERTSLRRRFSAPLIVFKHETVGTIENPLASPRVVSGDIFPRWHLVQLSLRLAHTHLCILSEQLVSAATQAQWPQC